MKPQTSRNITKRQIQSLNEVKSSKNNGKK